jgi:hypothetical protein
MANTFLPPAQLTDFDAKPALYHAWDQKMADMFNSAKFDEAGKDVRPAFYNPLNPPKSVSPQTATPSWGGYPKILTELYPGDIITGSSKIDSPVTFGTLDGERVTFEPFLDKQGKAMAAQRYRAQDEYLEWVVNRDQHDNVNEIQFTCEGPEYWETIATDGTFLQQMYQSIVVSVPVPVGDLYFSEPCTWVDRNSVDANGKPLTRRFVVGDYNPFNKWNLGWAVHLTHPANHLDAEVNLAASASLRFTRETQPVRTNPALTCCQGIGEPNRSSDPNIAEQVNIHALSGNYVTLRNPVGLYILSIDATRFKYPDGKSINNFSRYFQPIRMSSDGSMIVRAALRIPAGETYNGSPLVLSQLQVDNKPIVSGGQVAATITMGLFAQVIPGAPSQKGTECSLKPCPDPQFPSVIVPIRVDKPCPGHAGLEVIEAASAVKNVPTLLTFRGRHRARVR